MGLIKGSQGLQKLLVGYPTTADKYDVGPATVEGTTSIVDGDLLMFGSAHGLYKKAASLTAATQIAGICLATNVKMPSIYPAGSEAVEFKTGEAFNILLRGYVAVSVSDTVATGLNEGAKVYATAAGALTSTAGSNLDTGWTFTGVYENQGTTASPKYVAEILVK